MCLLKISTFFCSTITFTNCLVPNHLQHHEIQSAKQLFSRVTISHHSRNTIVCERYSNVFVDMLYCNIEPSDIENKLFYRLFSLHRWRNPHRESTNNCDNIVRFDAELFLDVDDEPIDSNHYCLRLARMAIVCQVFVEHHQVVS